MKQNKRQCPDCKKVKAMSVVKKYFERDWPGTLCKFCGHFVPDVVSEQYEISCEDCGKLLGKRAFDHLWEDLEEEKVQAVLQAEASRAAQANLELSRLTEKSKVETNPTLREALLNEIGRRTSEGLHVPRDFKLPPSWQKRHEEQRKGHFCPDCHGKRRSAEVDFEEVDTHVMHEIHCSICHKVVAWLYLEEHHTPDVQKYKVEKSAMDCVGKCAVLSKAITDQVRITLTSKS